MSTRNARGRDYVSSGPWNVVVERLHLRRLGAVLLLTLCACTPANSSDESLYTSVKEGDCRKLTTATAQFFESRGLSAEECDAPKGWRLFVVSSEERSWLELARDASLWSTEEQVVHKNAFGHFPNIGAEKVEWRLTSTRTPAALIFRIGAQNPQNIDKTLTRLFVLALKDSAPYFCGVAKTNEDARSMAENTVACSIPLPQLQLPKQQ